MVSRAGTALLGPVLVSVPHRVLHDPAALEDWLFTEGIAPRNWRKRVPDQVIAVAVAMHEAGFSDEAIAAHFAAASRVHLDVQARTARLLHRGITKRPLGGGWAPTPGAIESMRDAPRRRARRAVTRSGAGRTVQMPLSAAG